MYRYLLIILVCVFVGCGKQLVNQSVNPPIPTSTSQQNDSIEDDNIMYINGVVDYVSPSKSLAVIEIPMRHKIFKLFESKLHLWITSYDNKKLLYNVQVGKRYTFKVKPTVADVELRKGVSYQYSVWFKLIEVINND